MNRGDIVKITKKIPMFNGINWPPVFEEELINSSSLYAIYIRPAAIAPILSYQAGTYYIPAESFELQENAFCLISTVRRGKVIIVSFNGLYQLTIEGELVERSDKESSLSFDSYEEADNYIRDIFQVLTEW